MRSNPFEDERFRAVEYDAWYDTPEGADVLRAEVSALRPLLAGATRPWLDLGTGSGRFGHALGADVGIDPSGEMLRLAALRLPATIRGVAEALPFRTESLGAAVSVAVFEFLPAPDVAMNELARVLAPGGRLVIGFFPGTGPWARRYTTHGRDPRSVFHDAHFFGVDELRGFARQAGLDILGGRSVLFEPSAHPAGDLAEIADDAAGFAAISLAKPH